MKQSVKGGMPARRDVKFLTVLPGLLLLFVMLCPDGGLASRGALPAQTAYKAVNKNEILFSRCFRWQWALPWKTWSPGPEDWLRLAPGRLAGTPWALPRCAF